MVCIKIINRWCEAHHYFYYFFLLAIRPKTLHPKYITPVPEAEISSRPLSLFLHNLIFEFQLVASIVTLLLEMQLWTKTPQAMLLNHMATKTSSSVYLLLFTCLSDVSQLLGSFLLLLWDEERNRRELWGNRNILDNK